MKYEQVESATKEQLLNFLNKIGDSEAKPSWTLAKMQSRVKGILAAAEEVSARSAEEIHAEAAADAEAQDRKSTRLNSSHMSESRMPSSA